MRHIWLFFLLLVFAGCAHKKIPGDVWGVQWRGLRQSESAMRYSITTSLAEMQELVSDPRTKYKADYWSPLEVRVDSLSQVLIDTLDLLKQQILSLPESDSLYAVWKQSGVSAHPLSVKQIRQLGDYVDTLRLRIWRLGGDLNTYSPQMEAEVRKQAPRPEDVDVFSDADAATQLLLLQQLRNTVLCYDAQLLRLFREQVNSIGDHYDRFDPLVTQDVSVTGPGETIHIYAGIGAYSLRSAPKVRIDGRELQVGNNGFAEYRLRAPAHSGRYEVPVEISFRDMDGQLLTSRRIVKYQVRPSCDSTFR